MPRAPKVCGTAGCTTLTASRHCPAHTTSRWGKGNQRTGRTKHIAWSKHVRQRDKRCMLEFSGCTGTPDTADHIIPVAFGGPEYDPNNGQAACRNCHNRKSSAEGHQAQGHRGATPSPPQQPRTDGAADF